MGANLFVSGIPASRDSGRVVGIFERVLCGLSLDLLVGGSMTLVNLGCVGLVGYLCGLRTSAGMPVLPGGHVRTITGLTAQVDIVEWTEPASNDLERCPPEPISSCGGRW